MQAALSSLNYLAVIVVTIAGFFLGWLWYSPLLFAKAWMKEMKFTEESMNAAKPNLARLFGTSLLLTLISTFALAWLLRARGTVGAVSGAEFGAMLGLIVVGPRLANGGLWENRSLKLLAITIGHEVALFAMQGAILATWR